MHITQAAADKIQVDTMDTYHKNKGANNCNQGLEVSSGFKFRIKKYLQIIKGKYSVHIIN